MAVDGLLQEHRVVAVAAGTLHGWLVAHGTPELHCIGRGMQNDSPASLRGVTQNAIAKQPCKACIFIPFLETKKKQYKTEYNVRTHPKTTAAANKPDRCCWPRGGCVRHLAVGVSDMVDCFLEIKKSFPVTGTP